jgi:hypothetical protein
MDDCHFGYIIKLTKKTFEGKSWKKNTIMHDLKQEEKTKFEHKLYIL